jgi:hypothetical protein
MNGAIAATGEDRVTTFGNGLAGLLQRVGSTTCGGRRYFHACAPQGRSGGFHIHKTALAAPSGKRVIQQRCFLHAGGHFKGWNDYQFGRLTTSL